MRQNAINEFKLWSLFLVMGLSVLATEVVVKATRPASAVPDLVAIPEYHFSAKSEVAKAIPEELVARLLVDSVVMVESGGRPRTVGSRGERGLMQIMESTWRDTTRDLYGREITFKRAFEPDLNREVGTAYLAKLHDFVQANRGRWQADERSLLLACYNAGPQRVAKAGFDIRRLPASTRDYVKRASALHDQMLEEYAMMLVPGEGRGVMQIVQLPGHSGT